MFGLENQKKDKGQQEFLFELEKELESPARFASVKKKIEERIQMIKNVLRSGESKEDFDRCGVMLHGYTSLLKVINRTKVKK